MVLLWSKGPAVGAHNSEQDVWSVGFAVERELIDQASQLRLRDIAFDLVRNYQIYVVGAESTDA